MNQNECQSKTVVAGFGRKRFAICDKRASSACSIRRNRSKMKESERKGVERMDVRTPRQTDIVTLAKSEGRVSVEDLAERFNVTPQTIRKDLNDLCESGVLQRFHGGA